ncbi:phage head-tail connector protein [Clostridium cylindrosporum]|uniref:Phage gp6-like head-tail connector protein n=1 Tax=Clostridium cylindrosporum DSM 605 TaxID=1121307 RepID=A0A0J8D6V4_CLOCY|nr:phage head-tail connector protein [Clostridium cylindrosporum]KMT21592.1 phage gp6-like head-tail connector protein [Clostridium cylindrosporum DSM 605]
MVINIEQRILESLRLRINNINESLINDLIKDTVEEVKEYINFSEGDLMPLGCESIVKDLVVIKYNKQGSEGLQSESYGGISQSYLDDIPKDIKRRLNRYRKLPRGY